MRVIERSFSDLLRHPGDVTHDLALSDVLLRRRDEPDLHLTLASREDTRAQAFDTLARTFRWIAIHNPAALTDALGDVFAWFNFLPILERKLFAMEFSTIAAAGSELTNYSPLMQLVNEWRSTAEIYADPELARHLAQPVIAAGDSVAPPVA